MTLSNQQCIEVAEKVWGWKRKPEEKAIVFIEPGSLPHLVNSYFDINRLRDEINSWQGLGRTWDFFTGKFKHSITIDFCWHEDAQSWACNANLESEMSYSGYGETQIEAIHKCALDYLRKQNENNQNKTTMR